MDNEQLHHHIFGSIASATIIMLMKHNTFNLICTLLVHGPQGLHIMSNTILLKHYHTGMRSMPCEWNLCNY